MATTTFRQLFSKDWKLAWAERKKFAAYVATSAGEALAYGVVPDSAKPWVMLAIGVLGGSTVHQVRNANSG